MSVTRNQIVDTIRALGVRERDMLLAHSSMKSFGERVEGGAEAVAHALIDPVGAGGSAFVPVFNYEHGPFEVYQAPALTGAVTEAFRKLPGAIRSMHPTHSVAGIGPAAREVLEGHDRVQPFGRGSPLWRLWERNAWVLLVGVDHRASSMIHVAEELVGVPYLDRARAAKVVTELGIMERMVRRPGCDFAFNRIDPILRKRGRIHEAQVAASRFMLMRSADIVEAAAELLRADPAALLCDLPDDGVCDQARRMIEESRVGTTKPNDPA